MWKEDKGTDGCEYEGRRKGVRSKLGIRDWRGRENEGKKRMGEEEGR